MNEEMILEIIPWVPEEMILVIIPWELEGGVGSWSMCEGR